MPVPLNEILRIAHPRAPWRLRIKGRSMLPNIVPGDDLMVWPGSSARLGDIVVFPHCGELIAHRVIKPGRTFVTAGDASYGPIEHVSHADVVGVARYVIRAGAPELPSRSVGVALAVRIRIALRHYLRMAR
jgi:phage repressor protein C with HTH and peptisase S24 domain